MFAKREALGGAPNPLLCEEEVTWGENISRLWTMASDLADREPEMKRTEWLEACEWAYRSGHQGWLENVIMLDKKASTMEKVLNIQEDRNDSASLY